MQIVRERPCQRRHHRVKAPLSITLPSGETIRATDWSIGGSRVDNVESALPQRGEAVTLAYELPFQGFDISFNVDAKVVRTDAENGTIAFEHCELSERANDLMNHFINDLVRGQMATIQDTICRIDVPVTPISTKPDVNPSEQLPVRRLPIKAIAMSAFYVVLGVGVFGYLAILLYTNVMRMEVSSAVVSQPLLTIKMPMDGMLVPVRLEQGELLRRGDEIARIVSAKLEADIDRKRAEYEQKQSAQLLAKEKYRIESERMKLYQVINRTDRQIALARVTASREALAAADAAYERMSALKSKGLVDNATHEEAAKRRAETQARLEENEYELERATAMESVSDRRYFNHKEFVADLDMLALEIEQANVALVSVRTELEQLQQAREQLSIRAPFDGRIVAVRQSGHTTVLRDVDVVTLEKSETPTVTAFLTQEQILRVGLNDKAKVFLPSTGSHLPARVIRIDRNSSFLEGDASHYVWKEGKERSAAVSLEIDPSHLSDDIRAGLPAVVVFSRRTTNDVYSSIGNGIGNTVKAVAGAGDSDAIAGAEHDSAI